MEAAGVRRVILALFGQGREGVLPKLDQLARANGGKGQSDREG